MNRFIKLGTAALLSCFAVAMAGDASATGNIKPGQTIHTTFISNMDVAWDTTLSLTASTLDTIQSKGYCSRIFVAGVSGTVTSIAVQAVGSQALVPIGSTTKDGRVPQVNYKLQTYPGTTTWTNPIIFDTRPSQLLRGIIVDGLANGVVYIRFEP